MLLINFGDKKRLNLEKFKEQLNKIEELINNFNYSDAITLLNEFKKVVI